MGTGRGRSLTRKDVANSIQERIKQGEWKPGQALPRTSEFADQYGVGESTVYNAMDILKTRGVVTGQQGGRRYVAGHVSCAADT